VRFRLAWGILLSLASLPGAQAACLDYTEYLHWAGRAEIGWLGGYDVAVAGDLAFVTFNEDSLTSTQLAVFDVSDPAYPVELGRTTEGLGTTGAVTVVGSYVYVGRNLFFWVVDVSEPSSPHVANTVPTGGIAYDAVVSGGLLFAAEAGNSGTGALSILDVADPETPASVGGTPLGHTPVAIAVDSGFAYAAERGDGLEILDVSDPGAPQSVGSLDTPGYALDVAVRNGYAYVADKDTGLLIVDVSDPVQPWIAGTVSPPGGVGQAVLVDISGDRAYVGGFGAGLAVLDLSDPVAPVMLGEVTTGGAYGALALGPDRLYVAGYEGVEILAVPGDLSVAPVGALDTPGHARSIAGTGEYVFVSDGDLPDGVLVVDVSDPSSPTVAAAIPTPTATGDLAIEGDHAYVVLQTGLAVYDVSDPEAPTPVGSLAIDPGRLAVSGGFAYLVGGWPGTLSVVDVSAPAAPALVTSYEIAYDNFNGIAVFGNRVYLPSVFEGVFIVDVSNPAAPSLLGVMDTPAGPRDVAVVGSIAYVAFNDSGVHAFDLADPASPVEVARIAMPWIARSLAAAGEVLYVATHYTGLHVVDISVPTAPRVIGGVQTAGRASDLAIGPDAVYVADDYAGLSIAPRQCGTTTAPAVSASLGAPCFPNPFRTETHLTVRLARAGPMRLAVYDIRGRQVREWSSAALPAGRHVVTWDGRDGRGRPVPAGVYFWEARGGFALERGKITLVR